VSLRLVEATDEERWAQAESILVERPTEAAQSRLRRRRTMLWLLVVSALVLLGGVGVLLGLILGGRVHEADPPGWQRVAPRPPCSPGASSDSSWPRSPDGGRPIRPTSPSPATWPSGSSTSGVAPSCWWGCC
jgi:hypothetical protein